MSLTTHPTSQDALQVRGREEGGELAFEVVEEGECVARLTLPRGYQLRITPGRERLWDGTLIARLTLTPLE